MLHTTVERYLNFRKHAFHVKDTFVNNRRTIVRCELHPLFPTVHQQIFCELWRTLGEHWRMQAEFARIRTESAANWRTVRKNIFNFDSLGLRFMVGVRVGVLIVTVEIQNAAYHMARSCSRGFARYLNWNWNWNIRS